MPSPRAELKAKRGWTVEHLGVLRHGHDWLGAFTYGMPSGVGMRDREGWEDAPAVAARVQACIADCGDEVLADWIAVRPLTRPWFFWRYIAPEPLACIAGTPRYDRPEYADVPRRYRCGLPSIALAPDWGKSDEYESERDYLIRLNLLTDHERELLTAPAAPAGTAD